jgi:hypothetical protein
VESADDLADAITRHVQEHQDDGLPVTVTIDVHPAVRGGILRTGTMPIGTFSYAATTAVTDGEDR